MKILGFDWDKGNIRKNEIKHGVTSTECEQIFHNKPLIIAQSLGRLNTEIRFSALGKTYASRLLQVIFTLREEKIRVISARPMSKKERGIYEKEK